MSIEKNQFQKTFCFTKTLTLISLSIFFFHLPLYATVWPSPDWIKKSEKSQGVDKQKLRSVLDLGLTGNLPGNAILIRNGYQIFSFGTPVVSRVHWASCGRSFLTTMFGQAIKEGLIPDGEKSVDRPINILTSAEAKLYKDNTLLSHLLSYTSCSDPVGSKWRYACNYFSMVRIMEDLDGTLPTKRLTNLGETLGAKWTATKYWGHKKNVPFISITCTPAEAAKWGYLWLNKGKWKNNQIVDPWFVDRSLEPMPSPKGGFANENKGWQIHMTRAGEWGEKVPRDAYAALGDDHAYIFVCPSLNLVFAGKGDRGGMTAEEIQLLFGTVCEAVKR